MAFPEALRHLRLAANLSQPQLAGLAGVRALQISRYEQGKAQPLLDVVQRLCLALGCSADELLFDRPAAASLTALMSQVEALPAATRQQVEAALALMVSGSKSRK